MSVAQVYSRFNPSPYDLEIGDIVVTEEGVARQIKAVSPLYYDYGGTGSTGGMNTGQTPGPLAQGATRTDNILDLKPEDDEFYWCDAVGIDGEVTVQVAYPQGNPRQTPHNVGMYFGQVDGHRDNPYCVNLWVVPATYPQLNLSQPASAISQSSDIWFFGLKFKFTIVNQDAVTLAKREGRTVLYASRVYA